MSASPARPIPAIKTTGRVPAQYSPVCTLVTSGTAATAAGVATGVAAGLMDGDVATAGAATVELPVALTSPG